MSKEYLYSETFYSIQGEGKYTGIPTVWLRMFGCNLTCNGFGQKDPTDPSTYKLPYQEIDVSKYNKMEDLPVFEYGCDSSYSWSGRFKELQRRADAEKLAWILADYIPDALNKKFRDEVHLCFTGGEPLRKNGQQCITDVLEVLRQSDNDPGYITFETNGTWALTPEFEEVLRDRANKSMETFFSVSPKLFTVSGEQSEKAIKPENVQQYTMLGPGQLKFVLGTEQRQWDEMESVVDQFRKHHVEWPVYIMPVGARKESQEDVAGQVADMALERGYRVSARVHCYLWGNTIGT